MFSSIHRPPANNGSSLFGGDDVCNLLLYWKKWNVSSHLWGRGKPCFYRWDKRNRGELRSPWTAEGGCPYAGGIAVAAFAFLKTDS
jgi:hypothetical protein